MNLVDVGQQIDLAGISKKDENALQTAQKDLVKLCASWTGTEWDELDWICVKDLQLRNLLDERRKLAETAQGRACVQCPKFLEHVSASARCDASTQLLTVAVFDAP